MITYIYYRVLDKSDNVVFEAISNDIYTHQEFYEGKFWTLCSLLYSYFFNIGFTIEKIEFTTEELNSWLLERAKNRIEDLQSKGFIVHN